MTSTNRNPYDDFLPFTSQDSLEYFEQLFPGTASRLLSFPTDELDSDIQEGAFIAQPVRDASSSTLFSVLPDSLPDHFVHCDHVPVQQDHGNTPSEDTSSPLDPPLETSPDLRDTESSISSPQSRTSSLQVSSRDSVSPSSVTPGRSTQIRVMKRFTIPISRYINALTAENDSQSAEILSAIFNPGMGSQHRDGTSVHSMDVNMLPIASLADSIDWTMLNDISRRATTAKRLQYSE
ncbi:hypothetical protein BDZ45DRAFT_740832 [Acephala macrosclerotiorum]|nr:hypothetical protein BDZ45DRAFT_740832 [Acephala macrosclerotiorum]